MVEEAMGVAVVVMAAAGIHSELYQGDSPRSSQSFGSSQVTALPGDHLIPSACCRKVAVDGGLFPRYPISATVSEVTVVPIGTERPDGQL